MNMNMLMTRLGEARTIWGICQHYGWFKVAYILFSVEP